MTKAYIALGSNLQNPIAQIKDAFKELANLPNSTLITTSSLYQNPPIGLINQPDFINAVAKIETQMLAKDLLEELLLIEERHQRIRMEKNGPRTLDLDLLLFGEEKISLDCLEVPHPRMKNRAFVLLPLAEIEPSLTLPCGTKLDELLKNLNSPVYEIVS